MIMTLVFLDLHSAAPVGITKGQLPGRARTNFPDFPSHSLRKFIPEQTKIEPFIQ